MRRATRTHTDTQESCWNCSDRHCWFAGEELLKWAGQNGGLIDTIKHECYENTEVLHHRSQQCDSIIFIRSGLVKLVDTLENGKQRIVQLAGRGDLIWLSAPSNELMGYDIVAIRTSRICRIPMTALINLGKTEPDLYLRVMRLMQRSLEYTHLGISKFSTGPIQSRVARLILYRASIERRNPNEITLLSRQDMASILGVSQENISRCIAELTRAKVMKKRRRDVYFCDLEKPRTLADL